MTTIIKTTQLYKHLHGDLIYGNDQYLSNYKPPYFGASFINLFSFSNNSTWDTLSNLIKNPENVYKVRRNVTYKNNTQAIYPLGIFTSDIQSYIDLKTNLTSQNTQPLNFSYTHLLNFFALDLPYSPIVNLLGDGLIEGFNIDDGEASIGLGLIQLDNNDSVLVATLIWHNK